MNECAKKNISYFLGITERRSFLFLKFFLLTLKLDLTSSFWDTLFMYIVFKLGKILSTLSLKTDLLLVAQISFFFLSCFFIYQPSKMYIKFAPKKCNFDIEYGALVLTLLTKFFQNGITKRCSSGTNLMLILHQI